MYAAVMRLRGPDSRVLSSDLLHEFSAPGQDRSRDLIGRCSVLGIAPRRALVRTDIAPEGDDTSRVYVVTANYALPRS